MQQVLCARPLLGHRAIPVAARRTSLLRVARRPVAEEESRKGRIEEEARSAYGAVTSGSQYTRASGCAAALGPRLYRQATSTAGSRSAVRSGASDRPIEAQRARRARSHYLWLAALRLLL